MEPNEITKVHVVQTDSNYTETIKNAAIAGVVTVIATAATQYGLAKLTERAQLSQAKRATKKIAKDQKKTEE